MVPDDNVIGNVERFSGFANDYDRFRPHTPQIVIEILTKYLGRKPSTVVDLGCGTGLSSFVWKNHADRVIGVEPNGDMRKKAQDKLATMNDTNHISFVYGYSNELDIRSETVDVVTCSQSFHWMEPVSTLKEVSRVLKQDGIFAAYDCDWSPIVNWKIEERFATLMEKVESLNATHAHSENMVRKWNKEGHLRNIRISNGFRFAKEVVFHNREACDAQRYFGLALTQGGLQSIFKMGLADLTEDLEAFKYEVENHFEDKTLDIIFSYRMRIGIK